MPSGAKKRRAARRKKEEEARRLISTEKILNLKSNVLGNQDPIIHDQEKNDGVAATPIFTISASAVTEKEQKSLESNVGKHTDLCSEKTPDPPENEFLPETSIGFVSVKDMVSQSTEGVPAQSKPEMTSMVPENEENEDKVDQNQNHLSETSKHVENTEISEIPESSEPKALVVRKASWLSCCGLFDVITGSGS